MTASGDHLLNVRVPAGDPYSTCVCDVYLPDHRTLPAPVVITRTSYGRHLHRDEGRGWAARGFVYVVSDVRGRYDSDGHFDPYRNERIDGAALIDWVRTQPWYDGSIVAYGGSYAAYTAFAMAVERPREVSAVISLGPCMEMAHVKFDPSGVLRLYEHLGWWVTHGDSRTSRPGMPGSLLPTIDSYLPVPVRSLPRTLGIDLPTWERALDCGPHHRDPERITAGELGHLPMPTLHVGGWFDLAVDSTIEHFVLSGGALADRPIRTAIIGPWTHDLFHDPAQRFGGTARLDWATTCVTWIRDRLNPDDHPTGEHTSVSIFRIGTNDWVDHDEWPTTTHTQTLYTHSDGGLSGSMDAKMSARRYVYEPDNPCPAVPPDADRSALHSRSDVIVFGTCPLPEPLSVVGRPEVLLSATSTAPTADWIVRLLVRLSTGELFTLSRGMVVAAGAARSHRIVMSQTVCAVPVDSELLLEITSSDFPTVTRNLGTHGDRYGSSNTHPATVDVESGGGDRTRLVLPIGGGAR